MHPGAAPPGPPRRRLLGARASARWWQREGLAGGLRGAG